MQRFLKFVIQAAFVIAPAVAIAQPHLGGSASHTRSTMFHDRAPRPHTYTISPHH